jgi:hypothetical protein
MRLRAEKCLALSDDTDNTLILSNVEGWGLASRDIWNSSFDGLRMRIAVCGTRSQPD